MLGYQLHKATNYTVSKKKKKKKKESELFWHEINRYAYLKYSKN